VCLRPHDRSENVYDVQNLILIIIYEIVLLWMMVFGGIRFNGLVVVKIRNKQVPTLDSNLFIYVKYSGNFKQNQTKPSQMRL
jgi:hypothetical protein